MKKISKTEFARAAGVSEKTIQRWCRRHRATLRLLFTPPKAKKLHPLAVRFLNKYYCIDVTTQSGRVDDRQ